MTSSNQLHILHGSHKVHTEARTLHDSPQPIPFNAMKPELRKYVDSDLQGGHHNYRIQSPYRDEGDLVVFCALSLDDNENDENYNDNDHEQLKAQIFSKCRLPPKLYLSRKRRIQRLKKSANLVAELDQEDVKIFLSRPLMDVETGARYNYSDEDFPPLHKSCEKHAPDRLQSSELCNTPISFAAAASVLRQGR